MLAHWFRLLGEAIHRALGTDDDNAMDEPSAASTSGMWSFSLALCVYLLVNCIVHMCIVFPIYAVFKSILWGDF